MAAHGARQQQKLAKKKSQREQKRKQLAVLHSPGMAQLAMLAKRGVLAGAAVSRELFGEGIGYAWISRTLPDGRVVYANFLLDVWCLGVKNVMFDVGSAAEASHAYRHLATRLPWRPIAPPDLRNLVNQSVDYARSLGFDPHHDFRHAQAMLADIAGEGSESFTFGKDGAPLFVSGPDDSEFKCQTIAAKVTAAGGHYMIGVPEDWDEEEIDAENEALWEATAEDDVSPRLIA